MKTLYAILTVAVATSLVGCSAYERAAARQRVKGRAPQTATVRRTAPTAPTNAQTTTTTPGPSIPLEVKRPERQNLATISSPKRQASHEVVQRGVKELSAGQVARAVQTFQEAATIDGSNGVAYYYLARAHYQLGQPERAMGMLERAESLLGDADDWLLKIEGLRETIRQAQLKQPA